MESTADEIGYRLETGHKFQSGPKKGKYVGSAGASLGKWKPSGKC